MSDNNDKDRESVVKSPLKSSVVFKGQESNDPPVQPRPTTVSTSPYLHNVAKRRHESLHEKSAHNHELECNALKISSHKNKAFVFAWDLYSSFKLFGVLLITMETFVGFFLTIGATLLAYYFSPTYRWNDRDWDGALPTVLLSFATVTPLNTSINLAFKRREEALRALATYRSALYHVFMAQASWDWAECHKGQGRRGCFEHDEDLRCVHEKEGGAVAGLTSFSSLNDSTVSAGKNTPSMTPLESSS